MQKVQAIFMSVREVSPFPLSEGQALEYPAAIVWHSPDNLLSFWMGQTLFCVNHFEEMNGMQSETDERKFYSFAS